jgi:hypothetical protein
MQGTSNEFVVSKISTMFRLILPSLIVVSAQISFGQGISPLPSPTGPYKVGRTSFVWVDRNRPEVMTTAPDDFREVMAYAWYPASGDGVAGAYLPGAERLGPIASAIGVTNLFGPSWTRIESNELRSHSLDRATLIPDRKLPVLIFASGGGTTPIAYTTQMEEFASHGYLVVGVVHTYEAPFVVFPDGRVVTAANDYWARLRNEIPDSEKFEQAISDMLAQDIRFAIDRLIALDSDRTSLFYQRLETARIGVFGHSRGGRTAARVCQLERRVAACLSEDGSFSWQPFWRDAAGASMRQPFMMIDHLDPELPDEVFIQMGTSREAYAANRAARRDAARETIYKTIEGGSYHLTISTPGMSHNSFMDLRLLGRMDSSGINIWPREVQATTPHARILSVVTAYVRAFFDKYVRQIPAPLLEGSPAMQDVEARRYGAASK